MTEELAASLDRHYVLDAMGDDEGAMMAEQWVDDTLAASAQARRRAQLIGALALIPFIALLVAARRQPRRAAVSRVVRRLRRGASSASPAFRRCARSRCAKARHEYAEYYFLFPLFLSITLLTQAGFFDQMAGLIRDGVATLGHGPVAWAQFAGATFLSAILDNNIVADFASRALGSFDVQMLHLFAMAQIAGYALGGCWTHIGSAQSVVAYSFIQRDVDAALHAGPVDQADDADHPGDVRADHGGDRDRELAVLRPYRRSSQSLGDLLTPVRSTDYRERVARARIAGFHSAFEPRHALRRLPCVNDSGATRPCDLLLQAVVADRRRGVQAFFDVARIELDTACREPAGLRGFVSPHAGVTVGLQLDAHRALVRVAAERRALERAR